MSRPSRLARMKALAECEEVVRETEGWREHRDRAREFAYEFGFYIHRPYLGIPLTMEGLKVSAERLEVRNKFQFVQWFTGPAQKDLRGAADYASPDEAWFDMERRFAIRPLI